MAILKCKMCGGDLRVPEGASTAECEYCGSVQTIPALDDEKKLIQFDRAERLRKQCEFDKAAGIYETIVADFRYESEAYWGLVLCKYGIEYVDDPATGKKIPTCHRSSFESVLDDSNLELALENADAVAQKVYREEAKQFERLRKGILEVSSNEKPYDVFICYKETDEKGDRTLDSVLAQDLYSALTDKGYRVFFSRITLQGKLGEAYEPYIFAALNSAKVMLAVGTSYEYYNAVWVKNEWSRYLKICQADKTKHLIPCFKDLDPEDMPREFNHLQGADLGKMGAVQDILFNMEKYIPRQKAATVIAETVAAPEGSVAPLLKRAYMFLEDGDFTSANEYCEKVLDLDPENAQAYLGKLMVELKVRKQDALKDQAQPFDKNNYYQKALRFADAALEATLNGYISHIVTRNREAVYVRAQKAMASGTDIDYAEALQLLNSILEYKDASQLAEKCQELVEISRKNSILTEAIKEMQKKTFSTATEIARYEKAIELLSSIPGWENADALLQECKDCIKDAQAKQEKAEHAAKLAEKRRKIISAVIAACICAAIVFTIVLFTYIIPNSKYNAAVSLMEQGKYSEALAAFEALGDFKDSVEKRQQCKVQLLAPWGDITERLTIDAGMSHTVGLKADGTVVAVGNNDYIQCNVTGWTDIVAISAGVYHTVGLKADGTVVATGWYGSGQCDVTGWTDIVAISAGSDHTFGLNTDGTVVVAGGNISGQCDVGGWTDIVAISTGELHTVGLKADGTVVAVGSNGSGQCDVTGWTDIVAISAGESHTIGLKKDGTVVAVGYNYYGQCDVSGWTDIVAVSAGNFHTVGLKADGTVVAVGNNGNRQCDVTGWTDIVAVSASDGYTVGLKTDGTTVAVGDNRKGQCDVTDWTNIKTPKK